jgi:hypothetical protein
MLTPEQRQIVKRERETASPTRPIGAAVPKLAPLTAPNAISPTRGRAVSARLGRSQSSIWLRAVCGRTKRAASWPTWSPLGAAPSSKSTTGTAALQSSRSSTRPLQRPDDQTPQADGAFSAPSFFFARHPHCPTQAPKPPQPRFQRRRLLHAANWLRAVIHRDLAVRRNHVLGVVFLHQNTSRPPQTSSCKIVRALRSVRSVFAFVCVTKSPLLSYFFRGSSAGLT